MVATTATDTTAVATSSSSNNNHTHAVDPPLVHVAFHEQVLKTPDAPCLISGLMVDNNDDGNRTRLTYRQVQYKVLRLARELRNQGADRDKVVAIYMEPSVEYVIAMLAILSAGAAYVPLELAYPIPMLQRVLKDATPVSIVTKLEVRARLPASDAAVLCIDDEEHTQQDDYTLESLLAIYESWPAPTLDNLSFVVYSSGTTGQPKGIANPHRAPALSYRWRFDEILDYNVGDVVACNVFFVWEAIRPLMRGGAVMPIPASIVFDGDQLSQLLQQSKTTEMLFTPSLLENLLNTLDGDVLRDRLQSLSTVFLNGEVVSIVLRARCLQSLPHIRFINLYSISECHEVGAVDLLDIDLELSSKYCPIGTPCSVSPVYVLDEEGKLVSDGDAGELYCGGDMLAREYLNMPEQTKARFVPDPFVLNGRMYRTGDRARMLKNGQLEILGRCDFMVKIRGYSIVLGAVEAALVEEVSLSSCIVVADGEEGEEKHLVAYVVRAPPDENDKRLTTWSIDNRTGSCPEIRHRVDGALPHYMVPSVFIEVETLPVSAAANGKLDRKALQARTADRRTMLRSLQLSAETHTTAVESNHSTVAKNRWKSMAKYLKVPRNSPIEDVVQVMSTLWEAVLDREPGSMGSHSNFYENGGHSLSAARLVALVNKVFGSKIAAVSMLSDDMSVSKLSDKICAQWDDIADSLSNNSDGSDTEWSVVANTNENEAIVQQVRTDSILSADIEFQQSSAKATSLSEASAVFLTGATGFFGAHVLYEILARNKECSVFCLVRSGDIATVQTNLDRYKLKVDIARVQVVKGDLSQPMLGMDDSETKKISCVVTAIVHCAAAVSLAAPYSKLKATNVDGTHNVIRLASACASGTALIYVSSNGIFPSDKGSNEVFLENNDIACLPTRLQASDGYGLSKWAAERLVSSAHEQGLPTLVVRFGNLGWHSDTGLGNGLDFQGMILSGSSYLGACPSVPGWHFEVTPVDFAAQVLVVLAIEHTVLSDGEIFNCVQDGFTESEKIFEWLSIFTESDIDTIPYHKWKKRIEEMTFPENDQKMALLLAFVLGVEDGEAYLSNDAHLDCTKLDAALLKLDPSLRRKKSCDMEAYYNLFWAANN